MKNKILSILNNNDLRFDQKLMEILELDFYTPAQLSTFYKKAFSLGTPNDQIEIVLFNEMRKALK